MHHLPRLAALCAVLLLFPAGSAAAAPPSYHANSVIVKFRPGVSALQKSLALGGGTIAGTIHGLGADVARVSGDPATVAAALNRNPLVEYAEVNKILRATATPNDPQFGQMYGLNNTGQTGGTPDADIDAPEAWDAAGLGGFPATGGAKVGIVDTGIQAAHQDLSGKVANCAQSLGFLIFPGTIREGSCADDNGHGSHVAGTISANTNNGVGVAGVAFNSPLAICRALQGALGIGTTADVANCITWTHDKGAKVISMSLGGGASTTLRNAVTYAWKGGAANGSVLVAAAGNDGDGTLNYPAAYPEVVSVAATDNRDARASFSNANADVEIAAPGVNILSTWNNGGYNTISGTSMATPHVSGVTALIWNRYPGQRADFIRSKLDAAVDDKGVAGRDTSFGYGRVNAQKAATQ